MNFNSCVFILNIIFCKLHLCAAPHETLNIIEAVNDKYERPGLIICKFQEITFRLCRHLLVLISWLRQMRHCNKWMIKSLRGRDSPVSINT